MDANAKRELADAIFHTHNIREASYDKDRQGYGLNYFDAFEQACATAGVDPELQQIVTSLLISGYCEVWEFAERHASIKPKS